VRENLSDVGKMAKGIEASLYYVASTDENPQHHLCADGEDSWCGYKTDGAISFLKILSDLDITLGIFTSKGAEDSDTARIELSAKKITEKVKNRRKRLRHLRKYNDIDNVQDKEGTTCGAGAF
jgi:hypothetical protein